MADARQKAVLDKLLDIYSRDHYLLDYLTDAGPALGKGDAIDLPQQAVPTNVSPTTRAAAESLLPTVSTLTVDQELSFNVELPERDVEQLINGNWPQMTAEAMAVRARSIIDDNIISFLSTSVAFDTAGNYHDNVNDGDLTPADFALSQAKLLASADGVFARNMLWVLSPFAQGSIQAGIATWVPGMVPSLNNGVMMPTVGSIAGVPAIVSNGVIRNRAVASTGAVTTGSGTVHTYTVGAGHGLVPGMLVTVAGHDADENIATPTAITSVTATTIVVTTAATADGTSADTSGTITSQTSYNLLIDRSAVFKAAQKLPRLRVVSDYESQKDALQCYALWGRQAFAGRVRVMHSRGGAL